MASITCGNCKEQHGSVDEVRACYAKADLPTTSQEASGIPSGKYALQKEDDGEWSFYLVDHGKGRWEGYVFVSTVTGGPGNWMTYPIRDQEQRESIKARIAADPVAASRAFGQHTGTCGVCGSPLTNPVSVAYGIGPDCRAKYGW